METTQTCIKRREVLARGVGLAAASLVGMAISAHSKAAEKASKASLLYQSHPHNGQHCSECKYFTAGSAPSTGTCTVVEGAVEPNGWCMAFSAKT